MSVKATCWWVFGGCLVAFPVIYIFSLFVPDYHLYDRICLADMVFMDFLVVILCVLEAKDQACDKLKEWRKTRGSN